MRLRFLRPDGRGFHVATFADGRKIAIQPMKDVPGSPDWNATAAALLCVDPPDISAALEAGARAERREWRWTMVVAFGVTAAAAAVGLLVKSCAS
jgi:hypothetical protein